VFSSRFLIHEVDKGGVLLVWVRGATALVCEGIGDNVCNGPGELISGYVKPSR
jgi:hypothetical protein